MVCSVCFWGPVISETVQSYLQKQGVWKPRASFLLILAVPLERYTRRQGLDTPCARFRNATFAETEIQEPVGMVKTLGISLDINLPSNSKEISNQSSFFHVFQ